jgi:hypothetical protein
MAVVMAIPHQRAMLQCNIAYTPLPNKDTKTDGYRVIICFSWNFIGTSSGIAVTADCHSPASQADLIGLQQCQQADQIR